MKMETETDLQIRIVHQGVEEVRGLCERCSRHVRDRSDRGVHTNTNPGSVLSLPPARPLLLRNLQSHKQLLQDSLWDFAASSLQLGVVGQPELGVQAVLRGVKLGSLLVAHLLLWSVKQKYFQKYIKWLVVYCI